jgi:hypothetical protein
MLSLLLLVSMLLSVNSATHATTNQILLKISVIAGFISRRAAATSSIIFNCLSLCRSGWDFNEDAD